MYNMKRFIDFLLALIVIVLFLPLFLLLVLLVRIKLGNPVFFCQMRPGLYGKPFQNV